jgi:hypothetical protein
LKTHFDHVHSDNKDKHINKQDEIQHVSSDICSKASYCSKCKFSGNKSELDKHLKSKHGKKHECEECGINFMDISTLKLHVQKKHEKPSSIEPFPCEVCGLVLANFNLLQQHMKEHTPVKFNCQYCDFVAGEQESLQCHMFESHNEIAILCNIAKQVDKMTESFESFENFKVQISNVLKSLFDNQHILKQEMFLIRNNQPKPEVKQAKRAPEDNDNSSSIPAPSVGPPVPPPRTVPSAATSGSWAPPPVRITPAPSATKPEQILVVGDSISGNLHLKTIEIATKAKVKAVKAYCSVYENIEGNAKSAPKFPKKNFTDVIENELKKEPVDVLIIQSGSVDITNLKTGDGNEESNAEYFAEQTTASATNLFKAANNAAVKYPKLKKIVIMKQVPRYDFLNSNPPGMKSALSGLFNETLDQLLSQSALKSRVVVGNHNLDCSGGVLQSRYRSIQSNRDYVIM